MFEKLRKVFVGNWYFDGHGVNHDGERVLNITGDVTNPDNTRNEKHDIIGKTFAMFANVAERLSIRNFNGTSKEKPLFGAAPHLDLEVTAYELSPVCTPILSLVVTRQDGKQARFNITLAYNEGEVKCTMARMGATEAGDSQDIRRGVFVDWDKCDKEASEFDAAKMERFIKQENLAAAEVLEVGERFPKMKRVNQLRYVFNNHIRTDAKMLEAYRKA